MFDAVFTVAHELTERCNRSLCHYRHIDTSQCQQGFPALHMLSLACHFVTDCLPVRLAKPLVG